MAKRRKGTRRAAPSNQDVIRSLERGRKPSTSASWFASHPRADRFLRDWIAMRETHETTAGVRAVTSYLREHFDFPYKVAAVFKHVADIAGPSVS